MKCELFAEIGTQCKAFSKYINTKVVGISEIDKKLLKIYNHLFDDIAKISELLAADVKQYFGGNEKC